MPVGIFVDAVSSEGTDLAFDTFVAETRQLISGAVRLGLATRRVLSAREGSALASELGELIRSAAAKRGTTKVHLMLRTPFCLAVLLGQRLNTLEVSLFEWENGLAPPRYVQTLTIASGLGAGPILRLGPSQDRRST